MSKNKVRRAYSQNELTRILTLREDRFGRAFGMQTVNVDQKYPSWNDQPEDYYHFRDNGSSVLAVAHLDTVVDQKGRTPRYHATESGPLVVSGALDDRLGAYVILSLLPKLGVTCDWLLTVGEESGQSTASGFKPEKDYHHVIEFDRGGTDVVMYQYEDVASAYAVEASGARMGVGSFSDIAYLEHMGVKAFNWGVGYQGNYHSEHGFAYLGETFGMVAKYLRFHEQNAGITMLHDPTENRYGKWWDDDGRVKDKDGIWVAPDSDATCEFCLAKDSVNSITWFCRECGSCIDCGKVHPDIAAEWNDPDIDVCSCYVPAKLRRNDDAESWAGTNSRITAATSMFSES